MTIQEQFEYFSVRDFGPTVPWAWQRPTSTEAGAITNGISCVFAAFLALNALLWIKKVNLSFREITCKKHRNINSAILFTIMRGVPVPRFFWINIVRNLSWKTRNTMSIPRRSTKKRFISAASEWRLWIECIQVEIGVSAPAEIFEKFLNSDRKKLTAESTSWSLACPLICIEIAFGLIEVCVIFRLTGLNFGLFFKRNSGVISYNHIMI